MLLTGFVNRVKAVASGRSPKFIWAPCHVMCTAVLIGWDPATPSLPPHLDSWTHTTRALLVSKDRRHVFVAPWYYGSKRQLYRSGVSDSDSFLAFTKTTVLWIIFSFRLYQIFNQLSAQLDQILSEPILSSCYCTSFFTKPNIRHKPFSLSTTSEPGISLSCVCCWEWLDKTGMPFQKLGCLSNNVSGFCGTLKNDVPHIDFVFLEILLKNS